MKRVEGGNTTDADYWSDTLGMKNPKYTVALNFNMPIFNNIRRADVISNFKTMKDVEFNISKTRDDVRVQWANHCKDIKGSRLTLNTWKLGSKRKQTRES